MPASSAPTAKANILALIAADAGMAGVQVEYGHPGEQIQQEAVYFERTLLDEKPAGNGRGSREESYILELVVSVALDGNNPQACEERCWALVAVVENMLRNNPYAGGAVKLWAVCEAVEMTPGIAPNGGQRIAIAVMRVRCMHRK